MTYRLVPSIQICASRLGLLFPRAAFDNSMSNRLAATGLRAMIYVNAIVDDDEDDLSDDLTWLRPSMALWLDDSALDKTDGESRRAWWNAARVNKTTVIKLYEEWGATFDPPYADGTREGLRDETFPRWLLEGALRERPGISGTSSHGRWALNSSFADLFDPRMDEETAAEAIRRWRDEHMSPGGRLKAVMASKRADKKYEVVVQLPGDAGTRRLSPGESSVIIKGLIEDWAPTRLHDPVVLTISEPKSKLYMADANMIASLGIRIDVRDLLPDALIADMTPSGVKFWVIEVVATDGVIGEFRKRALLDWAAAYNIPNQDCYFLTAFGSRNSGPAKKRLKDLAGGTYAWFVDEPGFELYWRVVDQGEIHH
ncbi:BsuBI/PstI family type II restriction endonuclease [Pseudonocardia alni]|uniref:BsuBI/PstI family type II restriction endonuclease n=1 Tax=Pseudonocardia alni TaxID=33907 RepID=UPI003720F666